jgi:hypothetical protein
MGGTKKKRKDRRDGIGKVLKETCRGREMGSKRLEGGNRIECEGEEGWVGV